VVSDILGHASIRITSDVYAHVLAPQRPEAAELTVYRIVQESLTNTLTHAVAAQSVRISLSFREPDVTVRVTDDGQLSPLSHSQATASAEQDRMGG
jgi:signal transduction histidine kinase